MRVVKKRKLNPWEVGTGLVLSAGELSRAAETGKDTPKKKKPGWRERARQRKKARQGGGLA